MDVRVGVFEKIFPLTLNGTKVLLCDLGLHILHHKQSEYEEVS